MRLKKMICRHFHTHVHRCNKIELRVLEEFEIEVIAMCPFRPQFNNCKLYEALYDTRDSHLSGQCDICGNYYDPTETDYGWVCDICGDEICNLVDCGYDLAGEQNVLKWTGKIDAEVICKTCGDKLGVTVIQ